MKNRSTINIPQQANAIIDSVRFGIDWNKVNINISKPASGIRINGCNTSLMFSGALVNIICAAWKMNRLLFVPHSTYPN